jgi:hypothetical protein
MNSFDKINTLIIILAMINSRYKVTKLLGRGGNGQVWHAFDSLTSKEVAVKIVRTHFILQVTLEL